MSQINNKNKDENINNLYSKINLIDKNYTEVRRQILKYMKSHVIIEGNNEFNKGNGKYYINIANNETKIKLFILYCILFHFESKTKRTKRKYYIGIDFEFNKRKIALCQLCFFSTKKNKYIWVIDPKELDTLQMKLFIQYVLTSSYINKLLHGSESLDLPYLFTEVFMNDKQYIMTFVNKLIDTRFLCEYQKISSNYPDKKCSIYDALLYYKSIEQNKYDELMKINKEVSPEFHANWNIHTIDENGMRYAVYDVLFIKRLYIDIIKQIKSKQYYLINDLYRFVLFEKWNISNILQETKKIERMNNFIVKNKTMLDIYNSIINNIIINNVDIKDLIGINYFKSSVVSILKYIVYTNIMNMYTIYERHNKQYFGKLSEKIILTQLQDFKLKYLYEFVYQFNIIIPDKIKTVL